MADHVSNLLGPPELRNKTTPDGDPTPNTGDLFMDLMLQNFNRQDLPGRLTKGLTANDSPTYLSSGDPRVDFFFHVVPGTPARILNEKLRLSWSYDPSATLKLVCNLRGVRRTGKSDREGFFTAALWLHRKHPQTLASNIASFAEFGCLKDLPEILFRLLEGQNVRRKQKAEWLNRKGKKLPHNQSKGWRRKRVVTTVPREVRVSRSEERSKSEKEQAREERLKKRADMVKKVTDRYAKNWDFRFLYDKVSDHFARLLKNDVESLKRGDLGSLSLAAKWCPSIGSSYDRSTLLCESIARRMFPRELYEEGIEEAHYAYRVRDRLRKEVLVPLRKALQLPEVFMAENRWAEIPYNRVASTAMKAHKDTFLKHDGERFTRYLDDKKSSEAAEEEKKKKKKPQLKNCLAVCDVSEKKRYNKAVEVSLALGLVVSERSEEPWRGKIVTFGDDPKLHVAKGEDIRTKIEALKKSISSSGGRQKKKKDINKVFDLILQVAEDGNVKEEDMIKRVFVFSDMEFDRAAAGDWDTNYDVVARKFAERGYGAAVPEVVFWKVGSSKATPVPASQRGVALVGGFSKNLVGLFSDHHENFDPVAVMESAISGDEYQRLVVVD